MFRSYIRTALRNLTKNKGYVLINVLGLAIGIAASILIFIVLRFETSFDNFHAKKDRIYRIGTQFHDQDGISFSPGSSFPLAPALRLDFPHLKEIAAIFKIGDVQIDAGKKGEGQAVRFNEEGIFFAEPSFFKMFDFRWLAGDPEGALSQPNQVVLTRETAAKYFGDWRKAVGKTIVQDNKYVFAVSGILDDVPPNTDFPLNIVASYATLKSNNIKRNLDDWISTFSSSYCFVVVPPGLSPARLNKDLALFSKKHKPDGYQGDVFVAQPLRTIHYDERFGNYRGHTFSKSLIRALVLIGLFLLIIACVNFVNLATAQAVNRSREVGVRKVLGSNRMQLALQFLSETVLITLLSVLLASIMARVALPFLNRLLEVQMNMNILDGYDLILYLAAVTIGVSLLSGLYPAFVLSGFNPITALKTKISAKSAGGISLRRGLVVFQFVIAHVLIIGTLVVVSQMNFFRNASLGFEKAAIVNVPVPGDSISRTKLGYLKEQLLRNPDIRSLSFSFASPSADGNWNSDFKFDHATKSTSFSANLKWADENYFKTYNLQFIAGRPYYPSDTVREFVVNETLLRKLGITRPEDALSKELSFWDGEVKGPIVGVIRDFNSYSLRDPMAPVVLGTLKTVYRTINIRISPGKEKQTLAFLEDIWKKTYPDYVYQYQFLDETIASFYKQEDQLSQLYRIFAALAILISCLGLYGLVSFMAVQRTKEVGIRKVLGASAAHIVYLLSREFTLLILIAFVIAGPLAWYIMQQWLQNYTYRIHMGASQFMLALIGSILIAWITVGHRAIKTAMTKPVTSLRNE